jgi:hypothetical protein
MSEKMAGNDVLSFSLTKQGNTKLTGSRHLGQVHLPSPRCGREVFMNRDGKLLPEYELLGKYSPESWRGLK